MFGPGSIQRQSKRKTACGSNRAGGMVQGQWQSRRKTTCSCSRAGGMIQYVYVPILCVMKRDDSGENR